MGEEFLDHPSYLIPKERLLAFGVKGQGMHFFLMHEPEPETEYPVIDLQEVAAAA